jgi:HSP20 family molecular chaperone IbpA
MSNVKIEKVPAGESRCLPVFSEVDRLMERVREEAYELFAGRGYGDGCDLDDWLAAERLVFSPDTEIVESEVGYEVRVPLVGVEPTDISVTATPRELIVKTTAVLRRFHLPDNIVLERLTATYRNGLLTVAAPRVAETAAIEVPVAA